MKTFHRLLIGIVLLLLTSPAVLSQQQPEPKNEPAHKLVEFHMALLKHGPKWTAAETDENKRLHHGDTSVDGTGRCVALKIYM